MRLGSVTGSAGPFQSPERKRRVRPATAGRTFLPEREAVAITPAVARASAGASEHLRIARVANLVPAMETLQSAGLWVWGVEQDPAARRYAATDWSRPLAIVVGSEGFGLRRLVRERCDGLVCLPMHGRVGSLNAAVAGSVVLYEICRYREDGGSVGS